MFARSLLSCAALLALAALPSCALFRIKPADVPRLSEEEVEALISEHGGTRLTPQGISLGGGFQVSSGTGDRGIKVVYTWPNACREYCWIQVIRKFLDRRVVDKPTQLIPDPTPEELARPDFPDLARQEARITPSGWVVDHLCHPEHKGRSYTDAPSFPDSLFRRNAIDKNASVYVAEFELCGRCNQPPDPPGQWLGCIRWYYVKIRAAEGSRTYLVTTGAVAPAPTPQFTEAVDKWQAP